MGAVKIVVRCIDQQVTPTLQVVPCGSYWWKFKTKLDLYENCLSTLYMILTSASILTDESLFTVLNIVMLSGFIPFGFGFGLEFGPVLQVRALSPRPLYSI